MREKTMKKGHLLLTLLAFVCLMGLGTIHANAATVKAKVDVKKFYGIAEQVLQEINRQRRNNGLSDLKMDANFTEVAMDIALQKQGGDASASNPEIYNNVYVRKDAMEIDDIDGYDEYSDNLWKETRNGKEKILNHIKKVGTFLYKESDITSKIGIGVVATDVPQGIPRELNYGGFCNVTYCFISNEVGHDDTNYNPYVNNGKTVRTQMDLYIDSSNTYLIVDANENCLTPKYTYDVIKKGEKRKAHPGVWQHPVIFGKVHNELCRFKCKLSNTGASWSSSDSSVVSVDSNGNITAKKNGIATVTVKVGSLQATKKYVVSDVIGMDTDTLLYLPNWKSKSDIPKEYTGNCYAGGYALEVKNGRITWSKNMKTNKITRPGSKKSTVKTKKLKGSYYKIISKSKRTVQYVKPVKKNIISVTIPSSIKLNGKRLCIFICVFTLVACSGQQTNEPLTLGVNAIITEIDKENRIITTKDSGEEGVLGNDCLIDCSKIPMIYCNYDTQDVVDITFDDLQVGDEIILTIRSSEIENLQKEDDNKAKIAVEQLQLGTQRIK